MSSEYSGYRNGHTVGSAAQYRQRSRKAKVPPDQGLSNGLIILVIAIVVGCFAVLWPKYFYPMLFGESQHQPKFDPETMFMEGAHGREYLNNKLKEKGKGHPGVHPGTGDPRAARMTPPIRTAEGPLPGIRPGGMQGAVPPIQQEKGRGAIGYLMPIYTVGIIILFVYTAMKLMFKKKNQEEEEEFLDTRSRRFSRQNKNRIGGSTGAPSSAFGRGDFSSEQGNGPKYDEEYYNNLIRQQQQQQLNTNSTLAGSRVEDVRTEKVSVGGPGHVNARMTKEGSPSDPPAPSEKRPAETSGETSEHGSRGADSNKQAQDQKDLEIILLKARLEQTEKTLERLIGQMGALTTGLASAGVDLGSLETHDDTSPLIDDEEIVEEEEEDSDDEEEEEGVYDENDSDDDDDEDEDEEEEEDLSD